MEEVFHPRSRRGLEARLVRLERLHADELAAVACSHPGAAGPCMPRVRDGRCIWCERELPPAGRRDSTAPHNPIAKADGVHGEEVMGESEPERCSCDEALALRASLQWVAARMHYHERLLPGTLEQIGAPALLVGMVRELREAEQRA